MSQISSICPRACDTIIIVVPLALISLNLLKHFAWKFASPTARISSIRRISALTLMATENASLIYIPDEYVLTGLSINCCNSENSIISSSLSSISFLVRPNIAALVYMFSLPLMSGWNPAPSSRRLETLPHISIEPLSGYIILVNSLSVVLLPQPFLPIRPTASPFFTVKLILLRTTLFSYLFLFQNSIFSLSSLPLSKYTLKLLDTFLTSIEFSLLSILISLS